MKIKYTCVIAFALLLPACSSNTESADAADTPEARAVAVDRYVRAVPFDQFMHEIASEMSNQLAPEQRSDFVHFITKEVRLDLIESAAKQSLAKHLTLKELNALSDFMESPEGKSAMSKMKYYMADVMPFVQQEIARAMAARKATQSPQS